MWYLDNEIIWSDTGRQCNSFREQGPCTIRNTGSVYFSQICNTSYNRKNGPSRIHPNGTVNYSTRSGQYHRTDGPAVIWSNGDKEYFVNDICISAEEFFLKYGTL